jgi:hypothetical protein
MNSLRHLFFMYYYPSENPLGLIDAARFAEGLALVAATVMLVRQCPRLVVTLPVALVASATAGALSSVLLWRHVGVASALARVVKNGYRISGHLADPNAAGSYFGLIVVLAAGMAIRARGAARLPWIAATLLIAVGLWFSESRSAFGAVALVAAIALAATLTSRLSPEARAFVVGVVVAAGPRRRCARRPPLRAEPDRAGNRTAGAVHGDEPEDDCRAAGARHRRRAVRDRVAALPLAAACLDLWRGERRTTTFSRLPPRPACRIRAVHRLARRRNRPRHCVRSRPCRTTPGSLVRLPA